MLYYLVIHPINIHEGIMPFDIHIIWISDLCIVMLTQLQASPICLSLYHVKCPQILKILETVNPKANKWK